jgi:hypothetical protein
LATWLVIERPGPKPGDQAHYDVERNGRAFAYDLDLPQARGRITKSRRFDRVADKIVLVRVDGGRETLVQRASS